jgi:hypothetical protein
LGAQGVALTADWGHRAQLP